MEMIVCPHCGSLQHQTASLGAQLQCESCHKPFVVAPEEAETPTPMEPGAVARRVVSTLGVQSADSVSGIAALVGGMVAVLLAHACRAVMHTADSSRMLLEKLSEKK